MSINKPIGGGGAPPTDREPLDKAALGLGYAIYMGITGAVDGLQVALEQGYDMDLVVAALAGHNLDIALAAKRAARTSSAIGRCCDTNLQLTGAVPLDGDDICLLDPKTGEDVEGPAMYPLTHYATPSCQKGDPRPVWWGRKDGRFPRFVDANGRLLMSAPRPREFTQEDGSFPMYIDGRVVWSEGILHPTPFFGQKKYHKLSPKGPQIMDLSLEGLSIDKKGRRGDSEDGAGDADGMEDMDQARSASVYR